MFRFINVIIFFFFAFSCVSCTSNTPGTGSKIGFIIKVSKEGVFYETIEGKMIRGGLDNGSGTICGSFRFTIEDHSLYPIILEALREQKEVMLHYHTEFISGCWRSEDFRPHFVDMVEILDK